MNSNNSNTPEDSSVAEDMNVSEPDTHPLDSNLASSENAPSTSSTHLDESSNSKQLLLDTDMDQPDIVVSTADAVTAEQQKTATDVTAEVSTTQVQIDFFDEPEPEDLNDLAKLDGAEEAVSESSPSLVKSSFETDSVESAKSLSSTDRDKASKKTAKKISKAASKTASKVTNKTASKVASKAAGKTASKLASKAASKAAGKKASKKVASKAVSKVAGKKVTQAVSQKESNVASKKNKKAAKKKTVVARKRVRPVRVATNEDCVSAAVVKNSEKIAKRTYVAVSEIHGKGLFASKRIGEDVTIGRLHGMITDKDGIYTLWLDDDTGMEITNELRFINHSSDPNCELTDRDVVTLRPIAKDEELTHDYGW